MKRSIGVTVLALAVNAVLACSSGHTGGGAGNSGQRCVGDANAVNVNGLETEGSSSGQCGAAFVLTGTVPMGGACGSSSDCAPACCACPTGPGQVRAALCSNGACASATDACCGVVLFPPAVPCKG
jgi:hypothetical protein